MRGMVEMAAYLRLEAEAERLRERVRELEDADRARRVSPLTIGHLVIDFSLKDVSVSGRRARLTGKEWLLMEALALRPRVTISKDALMDALYGDMDEPDPKIIDVFICKIRRKLGPAAGQIEVVWGRGYRLVDEAVPLLRSWSPPGAKSCAVLVMEFVANRGVTFFELQTGTKIPHGSLRGTLQRLKVEGLLSNVGLHRSALYRLTPAGVAWLESRSQDRAA